VENSRPECHHPSTPQSDDSCHRCEIEELRRRVADLSKRLRNAEAMRDTFVAMSVGFAMAEVERSESGDDPATMRAELSALREATRAYRSASVAALLAVSDGDPFACRAARETYNAAACELAAILPDERDDSV
jgi:hypothetical protein